MLIEEGGFYRTRKDERAGPMMPSNSSKFPFSARIGEGLRAFFNADGTCPYSPDNDIIAPWPAKNLHDSVDVNLPTKDMDRFDRYRPHAAPGYEPLFVTLLEAHDQAARGKGKDRHANGKPFLQQPIMEIGRMVGAGYQTGQAMKKAQEAMGMLGRQEHMKAQAELLGAMNYLAAAYILIEEQHDAIIAANNASTINTEDTH